MSTHVWLYFNINNNNMLYGFTDQIFPAVTAISTLFWDYKRPVDCVSF